LGDTMNWKAEIKRYVGPDPVQMVRVAHHALASGFGMTDRKRADSYFAESVQPKLHVGCGKNIRAGWLNTDNFPKAREAIHLDATRRFPFADGTFDYIFSEHMIEHVPYESGFFMLKECRRVLKPGGRVRIATPDFAFLMDLTRADRTDLQRAYISWTAKKYFPDAPDDNPMFVINNFVREWGHTFIYDERTLGEAMTKAGLINVVRCDLQRSEDKALCGLEYEERMPAGFLNLETITLEAVRCPS
jgi:predicted SAM-dependent methyltransferase